MTTAIAPSVPTPTILRSTAAGTILPEERESVALWGTEPDLARRETARIAVPNGVVHLDVYPALESARGTLVFVGGLGAHALLNAGFLNELSGRGWNCVALDIRGHGRTTGRRGDFTTETLLEDLQGAIDFARWRFAEPGGVALMGSSLGGYYALVGANALTDVACAISHWIFLPGEPVTAKDRRIKPIALALNKIVPGLRLSTKSLAEWDHVSEDPQICENLYKDPLMVWKYTVRALAGGLTYSPTRPLTDLRVPHLVVLGEKDQMTPFAYTQRIFESFTGDKEWVTIPNAGHMAGLVEHRDEVLAAVDDYLERRLSASARRA
jgi:alpha-beta hydrolase superfamily lysophospholipase